MITYTHKQVTPIGKLRINHNIGCDTIPMLAFFDIDYNLQIGHSYNLIFDDDFMGSFDPNSLTINFIGYEWSGIIVLSN